MRFIDLFCGAGGFSQGFTEAGHQLIFGIDNWEPAIKTYSSLFGKNKIKKYDLQKTSINKLAKIIKAEKVDCIIGGPPCQGFSTMGKQKRSDPRNRLIFKFAKIIKKVKPQFFLLENVTGVTRKNYSNITIQLKNIFKSAGYINTLTSILNSIDYEVPQSRKRFFMLGCKNIQTKLSFPEPINKKVVVGDVLNNLTNKEYIFSNHIPMNHNAIVKGRLSFIPEGGNLDPSSLPKILRFGSRKDFKNNKIKKFSHIYKRLSRTKAAGTIVPGHNAFPIHPIKDRSLTVREAARIQTLGDKMIFFGTRQEQCILVGNAVPGKLALHLGLHLNKLSYHNGIKT